MTAGLRGKKSLNYYRSQETIIADEAASSSMRLESVALCAPTICLEAAWECISLASLRKISTARRN